MGVKEVNKRFIKFDNAVQILKYEVLKRVAKKAFEDNLDKEKWDIPKQVVDDLKPNVRCCIYKERAIVEERVRVALGGDLNNKNILEVIDIACDECPVNRFIVTDACRGCLAKKCFDSCHFGAISFHNRKCYIDYNKCKECGKCREACPYNAIAEVKRPCMRACYPKALTYDVDSKKAVIDNNKCIQCGSCVINCPFGAIMDKSFIVNIIELLKNNNNDIYAIIAPAVSAQFHHSNIGSVITAIKKLGFKDVVEVALGADLVANHEYEEFCKKENGEFMTSSCCPAFVTYIEKYYTEFKGNISNTVSPMIAIARLIKSKIKDSKIIFIGPCIAKKMESLKEEVTRDIDYVMTFEELLAMLDSKEINIDECQEGIALNGSLYGRLFAKTGGVTEAIKHIIEENDGTIEFNPVQGNGIKECDMKLKLAKIKRLNGNFLEGMACCGGCINGPGSLNHDVKNKYEVDEYGKLSIELNIKDALSKVNISGISLEKKRE